MAWIGYSQRFAPLGCCQSFAPLLFQDGFPLPLPRLLNQPRLIHRLPLPLLGSLGEQPLALLLRCCRGSLQHFDYGQAASSNGGVERHFPSLAAARCRKRRFVRQHLLDLAQLILVDCRAEVRGSVVRGLEPK
jgi:hypothetical protein